MGTAPYFGICRIAKSHKTIIPMAKLKEPDSHTQSIASNALRVAVRLF